MMSPTPATHGGDMRGAVAQLTWVYEVSKSALYVLTLDYAAIYKKTSSVVQNKISRFF